MQSFPLRLLFVLLGVALPHPLIYLLLLSLIPNSEAFSQLFSFNTGVITPPRGPDCSPCRLLPLLPWRWSA